MIAKPSIAFNDFSGSAKSVTARNVKGRTILSVKAYQSLPATPAQAVSRNILSKISRAYRQLTDSQMRAWEMLAEHLKGATVLGVAAQMTGHNAFVRLNVNRQMAGEEILADAPDHITDIPGVILDDFWVTPTLIVFGGIVCPEPSYKLVVRMSTPVSAGISNGWGKTVIITPGMEDDWGDADVTKIYNRTIGFAPQLNDKVFVEMYWMDTETGFVGQASQLTAIVKESSQIHGEAFVRRNQVGIENVTTTTSKCHFEDLDVEQCAGSALETGEVVGVIGGATGYISGEMADVPSGWLYGKTFFPGRGMQRNPYSIGLWEFKLTDFGSYGSYSVSQRFGDFDKNFDVFGTSAMVNFN